METTRRMQAHLTRGRRWLTGVAKLGLCGATIFAIGWVFLTFGPEGEVQESQADITDLGLFAPATSTQRFVKALDNLGHETPRIYNYNGNQIFFSTSSSPKRPRELILDYQRAFVEEGVNKKIYDVRVDLDALREQGPGALARAEDERKLAMLDGQIQVMYHDEERVIMGAAILDIANAPAPTHTRDPDGTPVAELDFANIFNAHRYIEATWHPVRRESVITASWGDESFDIKKTFPSSMILPGDRLEQMAPDLVVPTCLGCTRLTRFASEANDKPYTFQVFKSYQSLGQVAEFYRSAMSARGWKESKHSQGLERYASEHSAYLAGGQVMQFMRGAQNVTLTLHPDDDGTSVSVAQTD